MPWKIKTIYKTLKDASKQGCIKKIKKKCRNKTQQKVITDNQEYAENELMKK